MQRVGRKDALTSVRVQMGEMIEAAARSDEEAIEKLIAWGTEAAERGDVDHAKALLEWARSGAKRSRKRDSIGEVEAALESLDVQASTRAATPELSLTSLTTIESRASKVLWSLLTSSFPYAAPAAQGREIVDLCRRAYEMRRALAEAGEFHPGASGTPVKSTGSQLPFESERNVLGALARLSLAFRVARKRKEADALVLEACDMIVDAKRTDEGAIGYLVSGMETAVSSKNMVAAGRYAAAIASIQGDAPWLAAARQAAAGISARKSKRA